MNRSPEAEAYRHLYKTARWLRLRLQKLRETPLCQRCIKKGKVKAANVVNHRQPHKGNRNLFFDYGNFESLCSDCHDSDVQSEEKLGFSKEIGADGWPVDPGHPVFKKKKKSG